MARGNGCESMKSHGNLVDKLCAVVALGLFCIQKLHSSAIYRALFDFICGLFLLMR